MYLEPLYHPKEISFSVKSFYTGNEIQLTEDYYQDERNRINNILSTSFIEFKIDNIINRIFLIINSLNQIPDILRDVKNQIEKDRKILLTKYSKEKKILTEDYEKHKDVPEGRVYHRYNMPGRVDNFLNPWIEIIQEINLYIDNNEYNKDYRSFVKQTETFIDYLESKLN